VKYYGKVGGTNVITILVQAFNNGGFGGEPLAQVTVTNRPSQALIDSLTNALTPSAQMPTPFDKGGYKFMGLRSGTYYVRAFMDGNANGVIDGWETQGFVADTQGRPRGVLVGTQSVIMDHHLTLFDRDFDSDRLPDAWEWLNFATFRWTGDDDPNVTGVTLITHFAESYFDSDPTQPVNPLVAYEMNNGLRPGYDSDGDGLSDAVEVLVTRTDRLRAADVLRARGIVTTPPGMGMSLTWEGKDGVTYQVQKSADLKAWTDAAAGTYSGAGTKTFVDAGASNVVLRFYRIIVK
jgi:hypothetical protein